MLNGMLQELQAGEAACFQQYFNLNAADNCITVPIAQLVQAPHAAPRYAHRPHCQ